MSYNGFPSRAVWNVSLWVNNDPSLYAIATRAVQHTRTLDLAAKALYSDLVILGRDRTPDGVRFTPSNLRYALSGMSNLRLGYVRGRIT